MLVSKTDQPIHDVCRKKNFSSIFRTDSWIGAWIETYGKLPNVTLINLGEGSAQEFYCRSRELWKSVLPIHVLSPAGVHTAQINSPRAEYNNLGRIFSGVITEPEIFVREKWQAINIPDVLMHSDAFEEIQQLASITQSKFHISKTEPAYSISAESLDGYLKTLASPIRSKYFHRRERLHKLGSVEYQKFSMLEWHTFINLLNGFHANRWGRQCYSELSVEFLHLFCDALIKQGGEVALECIRINGVPVSVLFDVIWKGRRYNFQSGYDQTFQGVSLGAIHLGYAIESAIANQQTYDLMAGKGKSNNYKKDIATNVADISSILLLRSYARYARTLYDLLRSSNSP